MIFGVPLLYAIALAADSFDVHCKFLMASKPYSIFIAENEEQKLRIYDKFTKWRAYGIPSQGGRGHQLHEVFELPNGALHHRSQVARRIYVEPSYVECPLTRFYIFHSEEWWCADDLHRIGGPAKIGMSVVYWYEFGELLGAALISANYGIIPPFNRTFTLSTILLGDIDEVECNSHEEYFDYLRDKNIEWFKTKCQAAAQKILHEQ